MGNFLIIPVYFYTWMSHEIVGGFPLVLIKWPRFGKSIKIKYSWDKLYCFLLVSIGIRSGHDLGFSFMFCLFIVFLGNELFLLLMFIFYIV